HEPTDGHAPHHEPAVALLDRPLGHVHRHAAAEQHDGAQPALEQLGVLDVGQRPALRVEAQVEVREQQQPEDRRLGADERHHPPPSERAAGRPRGAGGCLDLGQVGLDGERGHVSSSTSACHAISATLRTPTATRPKVQLSTSTATLISSIIRPTTNGQYDGCGIEATSTRFASSTDVSSTWWCSCDTVRSSPSSSVISVRSCPGAVSHNGCSVETTGNPAKL